MERVEIYAQGSGKASGRLLERQEPDEEGRVWRIYDTAGTLLRERPFTAEEIFDINAAAEQAATEEAALRALSQPTIDEIGRVLEARGLAPLSANERANLEDRLTFLTSRGQLGKPA